MNIVLDRHFEDLDILATETQAWDLDFRLTQRGGFLWTDAPGSDA